MKKCCVHECAEIYYSKGFCKKHYDKQRRQGNPLFERVLQKEQLCAIKGCSQLKIRNDMCGMHNMRQKRHGDPDYINPKCNRDGNYLIRARAKTAQWKKDNKETYNAYLASRKARVRKATPSWADLQALREFYFHCPEGYHVDHVIPLNGKYVSGLHIVSNLQYLPALDNLRKSNKVA